MKRLGIDAVHSMDAAGFALWRVAMGGFLAVHFAALLPYAPEIYGPEGVFPDASTNLSAGALPPTPWLFSSALATRATVGGLTLLSVGFALGFARRLAAVLIWAGLVMLLHRNNLTHNVSLPYLGWLLLASTLVPTGEGGGFSRRDPDWAFPKALLLGAWVVFGVSYTLGGWVKLQRPEWWTGDALGYVFERPITHAPVAYLASLLPEPTLRLASWGSAGLEGVAAAMILLPSTRLVAWWGLTGLQLGILATMDLAELSVAVLLFHLFLYDPTWPFPDRLRRLADALAQTTSAWQLRVPNVAAPR